MQESSGTAYTCSTAVLSCRIAQHYQDCFGCRCGEQHTPHCHVPETTCRSHRGTHTAPTHVKIRCMKHVACAQLPTTCRRNAGKEGICGHESWCMHGKPRSIGRACVFLPQSALRSGYHCTSCMQQNVLILLEVIDTEEERMLITHCLTTAPSPGGSPIPSAISLSET